MCSSLHIESKILNINTVSNFFNQSIQPMNMKKIALGLAMLCLGLTSCKESALETPQLASKGNNKVITTTTWTYVGDIPENVYGMQFSFVVGNKAYFGQGNLNHDEYFMNEYDSENNIWR